MYEKLPQELKERGAFCLWKYEERDGSRTKVPYQTNGLRADSANKSTFTDYAIAVRHRAGYDGLGIGVFGDICAIDIDSCVENDVLSDMAEDIIARMDTYTEYSPSGTGVRILLFCFNVFSAGSSVFFRSVGGWFSPVSSSCSQ